jgi:hypothetical protein
VLTSLCFCNQKYRPLSFLAAVAVEGNRQVELCARLKAVNGDQTTEDTDIVNAKQFKEYGTGINKLDVSAFLDWFLGPSLTAINKGSAVNPVQSTQCMYTTPWMASTASSRRQFARVPRCGRRRLWARAPRSSFRWLRVAFPISAISASASAFHTCRSTVYTSHGPDRAVVA